MQMLVDHMYGLSIQYCIKMCRWHWHMQPVNVYAKCVYAHAKHMRCVKLHIIRYLGQGCYSLDVCIKSVFIACPHHRYM